MNDITDEDVFRLRRMLGMDSHRSLWGYRNRFAPGPNDIASMERLEEAGLVMKGGVYKPALDPAEQAHFYHATLAGCRLVGLTATEIKRAMRVCMEEIA